MQTNMNDSRINDLNQLKALLKGSQGLDLSLRQADLESKYQFIDQTIDRFQYLCLKKKEKRVVRQYLKKLTGYQHSQLNRLIKRAKRGHLTRQVYRRINPHRIYTSGDVKLLEETDELHLRLSEKATKEILRRECEVFGKSQYQTIAGVSHAHLTNLRHSPIYRHSWVNYTKAREVPIGLTMPPENQGKPGSIRVDTVHQREVYHLNSVDEITQWEIVVCVPQIAERYMLPALMELLNQYPFVIFNFHSDRGGETINHLVADLLQRLLIKQTKSRSYHCHDNALVETKNGAVIRKNMGWEHVHQQFCNQINGYYHHYFNPYLNFHRPCGFPTITTNRKGKKKKAYDLYQVPYEHLKSLPKASQFLKAGLTFDQLDKIAYQMSDNDFAQILRNQERELFADIRQYDQRHGSRR